MQACDTQGGPASHHRVRATTSSIRSAPASRHASGVAGDLNPRLGSQKLCLPHGVHVHGMLCNPVWYAHAADQRTWHTRDPALLGGAIL